ncbi:MAG: hypothetical protein SPJ51_02470 [Candidatus Enterosoma sp.]|nr:hypothetical protein [bacterium]MDY5909659.1 hypothetical protein [Candidatus Enterosoma sp.]
MKKEINSKSKRKWVAGGLAAFASIALLTTGFATWVVGQKKIDDDDSVTVNVDTAHNESVEFTVELPSAAKIELKEGKYNDSNDANRIVLPDNELGSFNSKAEYDKACLTISGVTITIKFGSAYQLPEHINFSISEPQLGDSVKSVKVASENKKFSQNRSGNDFCYLSAPASISTKDTEKGGPFTKTENGGTMTTLTYTTALEFTWGNFFNNTTPAEYYNNAGIEATSENYNSITAELDAMKAQLGGGSTINLHAELGA